MYIQIMGHSIPLSLAASHDHHDLASRAALPADAVSTTETSSLFPLLALTTVFAVVAFALTRLFRHFNPNLGLRLPNYRWLRGKGQGAKGRLGLSGVELLPTSMKSIPTPSPSPRVGVFVGSSNVGKGSATSSLLSRSSSLETLPQFPATPTPHSAISSPIRSRRGSNTFKFSIFPSSRSKTKKTQPVSHRRSKSLGFPIHHLAVPSSPLASVSGGSSAPNTPLPQPLLIDFSSSSASSSSNDTMSGSSKQPSSCSSDLGTQRFSNHIDGPLIPIPIPIPTHSTPPLAASNSWALDLDGEEEYKSQTSDPLMQAFKREQPDSAVHRGSHAPLIVYDSSPPGPAFGLDPSSDLSPMPRISRFPTLPPGLTSFAKPTAAEKDIALDANLAHIHGSSPRNSSEIELVSFTPSSPCDYPRSQKPGFFIWGTEKLVDLRSDIGGDVISGPSESIAWEEERLVDFDHADVDVVAVENIPVTDYISKIEGAEDISRSPAGLEPLSFSAPGIFSLPLEPTALFMGREDPISVTVEPPTPMPSVGLSPLKNDILTTPAREVESLTLPQSIHEITRSDEIPLDQVMRVSSPPCQSHLIDLVDTSEPPQGLTSSVQTLDSWHLEDAWNFRMEQTYTVGTEDAVGIAVELVSGGSRSEGGHDNVSQANAEAVDIIIEDGCEEAWFAEEVTAVWPQEDIEANMLKTAMDEKDLSPIPFFGGAEPSVLSFHDGPSEEIDRVQEAPAAYSVYLYQDDFHEPNDSDTRPTLEPHPTPLITISINEFPDPDCLPLPDLSPRTPLISQSDPPSPLTGTKPPPSQMPTPPASPPASPSRFLPTSALSSPSNASESLPKLVTSPATSAATPTSSRPAWSLRAADAPALGIPSPTNLKQRSSPDLRAQMRLLTTAFEGRGEVSGGAAMPAQHSVISVPPDECLKMETKPSSKAGEGQSLVSNEDDNAILLEAAFSTSLPGSFPDTGVSAKPPSVSLSAYSTALVTSITPTTQRRQTPRSPLDIALAMQLRPGLGLGADPAWMVRFLMSMFGWFAILLSGQAEFDGYSNGGYPAGH